MKTEYKEFGFYRIDIDYVRFLHSKDSQVFYVAAAGYEKKPYLGIIATLGEHSYCIPLSSAKPRHLQWRNITEHNYLIYEIIQGNDIRKSDIYRQIGKDEDDRYKKIQAILDLRKMIPVHESLYSRIVFDDVDDNKYRGLLLKEYAFLVPHKEGILHRAKNIYIKQKESSVVERFHCNFTLLEAALSEYMISGAAAPGS